MVRRRTLLSLGLPAPLLALVAFACGDLKDAANAADGGGPSDATSPPIVYLPDGRVINTTDATIPPPIAQPDAGPAPLDSECARHDEWVTATKATATCAARQVSVVEDEPLDPQGISITRTPAGRVGIAYNSEVSGDGGEWHLAHFIPATSPPPMPTIVVRSAGDTVHEGYRSRLSATAPDTINALTLDVDDSDFIGALNVTKLVNGAEPLATKELVIAGVQSPSEIGYAVDSTGMAYATARFATNATTAKLIAFSKATTGGAAWKQLPDLFTALAPKSAAGIGQSSLFIDANLQLHVLFQDSTFGNASTPRYQFFAATDWSTAKTVDNGVRDGFAGFNPSVVTSGNRKYALFFYRKSGQTGPDATADLRLATWTNDADEAQIQILEQTIPSSDVTNPLYRAVMAIDKYGLLHVAEATPDPGEKTGSLEYLHQTSDGNGGTTWLRDVVDPSVISENAGTEIAMVVDETARPHIAYTSGVDGKVRYATRYDR